MSRTISDIYTPAGLGPRDYFPRSAEPFSRQWLLEESLEREAPVELDAQRSVAAGRRRDDARALDAEGALAVGWPQVARDQPARDHAAEPGGQLAVELRRARHQLGGQLRVARLEHAGRRLAREAELGERQREGHIVRQREASAAEEVRRRVEVAVLEPERRDDPELVAGGWRARRRERRRKRQRGASHAHRQEVGDGRVGVEALDPAALRELLLEQAAGPEDVERAAERVAVELDRDRRIERRGGRRRLRRQQH